MNRTMRLVVDLEFDDQLYGAYSEDESEREWFRNDLLKGSLMLSSGLVGDDVGSVKVLKIIGDDVCLGDEPDYYKNKVLWIKWYRRMTDCSLREAVDEGKARFD